MPFATVNSGVHQIQLHYELLVGDGAWEDLLARESASANAAATEAEPSEQEPLSTAEQGGTEGRAPSQPSAQAVNAAANTCRERVLFIPGLASKKTTEWFEQQVRFVTSLKDGAGRPLACVCIFDNRGVGRSGVPERRDHYSTDLMCTDVLHLMDHLGWDSQVHVVGQSLGALVTMKLAAAAPHRLKSVTITGGVLHGLHMLWSGIKNAPKMTMQFFFGGLRSKIESTLTMNYTHHYLAAKTEDGRTNIEAMAAATEADIKRKKGKASAERRQRNMSGRRGQLRASFGHRMSRQELEAIAGARHFRVVILHGWQDGFISPSQAFQLGKSLRGIMVTTEAAHAGIGIEAAHVVNGVLRMQLEGGFPQPIRVEPGAAAGPADPAVQKAAVRQQGSPAAAEPQVFNMNASSASLDSPRRGLVKRGNTLPTQV